MSNRKFNVAEANRIIKSEGEMFDKLSKIFSKLYSAEEKNKNIRKECFQNFATTNKIQENDNASLKELYQTFGKEMQNLEENFHEAHLNNLIKLIIPILQNYSSELKKNKDNLDAVSKAIKNTEDLKKSFGGPEDIRKSQIEEQNKTNTFGNKYINYEKQRVEDSKQIIAKFIHSEMKYHCQALEKLSKLFVEINKTNVNIDLKKFSQEYGIKKYDFDKLDLDMDEILKQKEENDKSKMKNKSEVFNGEKDSNSNKESDEDGNTDKNDDDDNNNTRENNNHSRSVNKSKFTNKGKSSILNKSKQNNKMSKISESKNLEEEF